MKYMNVGSFINHEDTVVFYPQFNTDSDIVLFLDRHLANFLNETPSEDKLINYLESRGLI